MDVFISYGEHGGAQYAEHLKDGLEKMELSAFVAKRDIPVGDEWEKVINKAIDDCENFVVILTPDACVSDYVLHEINRAKNGAKRIIPCKPERSDENDIPEDIRGLHRIDFKNEYELFSEVWYTIKPSISIPTIVQDSIATNVDRILKSRQQDENFNKELKKELSNSEERILMMGNALMDFWGDKSIFFDEIKKALKNGATFQVIMLDPTSEAAYSRAKVENRITDDEGYLVSNLYRNIKKNVKWLKDPPVEEEIKRRMKGQVEIRFSNLVPTAYMIKTDSYIFIEQYHMGDLAVLRLDTEPDVFCIGGFVPLFMAKNDSNFALLMKSHFSHIWQKMEKNTLDKVSKAVDEFEKDHKKYRMQQIIEYISKKSIELKLF